MASTKLIAGQDFQKAIETLGAGDELLLPRGARFEIAKTPTIRKDDIRIGAYGDPALPAPVIRCTGCGGLAGNGRRRVRIAGLKFECVTTPVDDGISFLRTRGLVLDDVEISGFIFGVTIEGYARGDCSDVTIRRCRIHDNYHPQRKHSSGLFASFTDTFTLENNVFDTNGWKPGKIPGGDQNHNVYLHATCGPATVRGNVFANASSHGLQQRSGGVCEGNVFVDNPIHHSFGLVNGSPGYPGGVSGAIRGNVYVGSRDINGSPRGWAIELANVKSVELADLLIAHDTQRNAIAIQVNVPQRAENGPELVGVLDLKIGPTVFVWDWPKGPYWKNSSIVASGTGMKKLGTIERPDQWAPPTDADLRKIINLPAIRLLARQTPTDRTAADLIHACRIACGIDVSTPTPPEPTPESVPLPDSPPEAAPDPVPAPVPAPMRPDVGGALEAAHAARACLPDDPAGAVANVDAVIALLSPAGS